mmetsp:Transcript_30154/g.88177  ORF Transcript_30154/g.88177 Transcript_30154/m.88177 type:complete len:1062 (+) Transcript_30154:389-3574(+)
MGDRYSSASPYGRERRQRLDYSHYQRSPLSSSRVRSRGRSRHHNNSRGGDSSRLSSSSYSSSPLRSSSCRSDSSRRWSSFNDGTDDAIGGLPDFVGSVGERISIKDEYSWMVQDKELPPQHLPPTQLSDLERFQSRSWQGASQYETVLLPDSIEAALVCEELASDATVFACICQLDPKIVNEAFRVYNHLTARSPAINPTGLFLSLLRTEEKKLVNKSSSGLNVFPSVGFVVDDATRYSGEYGSAGFSHPTRPSILDVSITPDVSFQESRIDAELNNASDNNAPREGGSGDMILIDETSERDDGASHVDECSISFGPGMQEDHSTKRTESTKPTVVANPPSGMDVKVFAATHTGTCETVAAPDSSQSLDGIIRNLSLPAAAASAASALCSFQETDLVPYASRVGDLIPQLLVVAKNHPDQEVRSCAKRLSVSLGGVGQTMNLVTKIADAARSKDFPCLVDQLRYVYALEKPWLLSALLENGGVDALYSVLQAFPGTNLASFALMNIGRLTASNIGSVPKVPTPPLGVGASVTEKEVLAIQALENLGLKEDASRPPIKSFVQTWMMYKSELNEQKYGHGLRQGEELTIQQAYAAEPRFPFDMTEFDDFRSDIAKLVLGLRPVQAMMKDLHRRYAVQCAIPADSKLVLGKVRGRTVVILLHNFPTQDGGALMMQNGLLCGEGDYCLTTHGNILSCLEQNGKVPPGATNQYERRVIHFDTNPTVADKNWSTSQGNMPCTKARSDSVVRPYLGPALLALVTALQDDHGVTEVLIVPCGDRAAKAFDCIDDESKQELSARINRAMGQELRLAHGWTLARSDKPKEILEDHISGMQRIGLLLSNAEKVESLIPDDFASVVYNCNLSAGYMSKERRAKAGKKVSDFHVGKSVAQKTATSKKISDAVVAGHAARTVAQKVATSKKMSGSATISHSAMSDAQKAAWNQNKLDGFAAKKASKPYPCVHQEKKKVTIIRKTVNGKPQNVFKGLCKFCAYDEADILATFEAGYDTHYRPLRWINTKQHGVVLAHYSGGCLCGIISHRSSGEAVRKEDFEMKMPEKKRRKKSSR